MTKDPARRCSRTLPYKHGTVTGLSHRDSIHLAHLGYTHQLWCCFPWWKRGVYWICPAAEQIHTNDTALLYKRFKATVWHCRVCNRNRFLQQRLGKVQTFAVHSSSTRASEGQVEVLLVGWQKANTCKKGPNMSQLQSIIGGQNGPTVVLTVRNVRSFMMASMVVLRDLQTCSHSGTVPQIGFVEVTIQLCHHLLQAWSCCAALPPSRALSWRYTTWTLRHFRLHKAEQTGAVGIFYGWHYILYHFSNRYIYI